MVQLSDMVDNSTSLRETILGLIFLIAQKGRPLLSSGLQGVNVPHIFLNGPLAHVNVQFQEFATNPFSTPQSRFFAAISLIKAMVSADTFD